MTACLHPHPDNDRPSGGWPSDRTYLEPIVDVGTATLDRLAWVARTVLSK
jgi:hypothetical protein